VFTHFLYFPFLILTAWVYWLLPKQTIRTAFLTICSYGFIGYLDFKAMYVVVALTAFTYLIAKGIEGGTHKKAWHRTGVIGLVAVLVAFKYLGFLAGVINSLSGFISALPAFRIERLFLPLGISYIVFKYISYLTDIYWGLVKKGRLLDFACYGSLYTIFVAGPIERFERLKPQLEKPTGKFELVFLDGALRRVVVGLFKKMVLADWLGYMINPVWDNPGSYSALIRVVALFGYSLQIYFDFAGYSDIAIGSSGLFGLKIMENFDHPYQATSISQFWRRWHISLSDWIRDYLFFPLSQNKTNKLWLTFFVPVIAMGLCGLWHGSAWIFIVWGIWHGIGISTYQIWQNYKRKHKVKSTIPGFLSQTMTYAFVCLGWIIFRGGNELLLSVMTLTGIAYCLVGLMVYYLFVKLNLVSLFRIKRWVYYILILLLTLIMYCGMSTGFIYGQF
jgi:alginate O-acetyltransferase complex protein AlgI